MSKTETEEDSKKWARSIPAFPSNRTGKNKMHALQNIPFSNEVTQPIAIDLCNVPEGDRFKHLIVCHDYFSKRSEAKTIIDKFAPTVANFCTG